MNVARKALTLFDGCHAWCLPCHLEKSSGGSSDSTTTIHPIRLIWSLHTHCQFSPYGLGVHGRNGYVLPCKALSVGDSSLFVFGGTVCVSRFLVLTLLFTDCAETRCLLDCGVERGDSAVMESSIGGVHGRHGPHRCLTTERSRRTPLTFDFFLLHAGDSSEL